MTSADPTGTERHRELEETDLDRYTASIETLIKASENDGAEDLKRRFHKWRENVQLLKNNLNNPSKLKIVVHGRTGSGKSSLLNALFNCSFLPSGGDGDACTSVITRIETVDQSRSNAGHEEGTTPMFEAEICFLKPEDLDRQINLLKKDYTESEDESKDKNIAKARLQAIYDFKSIDDLGSKMDEREDIKENMRLGKKTIQHFSAEMFEEEISHYVSVRKDSLWPIVSSVNIKLHNLMKCYARVVFTDIPGTEDPNPVRTEMTNKEQEGADLLLLVVELKRCKTDSTLQSIIGRVLSRQIEMDQLDYSIVCTHTDVTGGKTTPQKVEELPEALKEKLRVCEEAITSLKKKKHQQNQLNKEEKRNLKKQTSLLKRLNVIARNYAIKHDLGQKSTCDIYCVSSTNYMQMIDDEDDDDDDEDITSSQTFKDKEDTGIPELQAAIYRKSIDHKKRELKTLHKTFRFILSDTITYLQCFQLGRDDWGKDEADKELQKIPTLLRNVVDNFESEVDSIYEKELLKFITTGVQEARKSAMKRSESWSSETDRKVTNADGEHILTNLPINTFKAAARRGGSYIRGQGQTTDFNEDLADPLISQIHQPWLYVFGKKTWTELIGRNVIQPARKIFQDHSIRIQNILQDKQKITLEETQVKEEKLEALKDIYEDMVMQRQRKANRLVTDTIKEAMKSTYAKCAMETGDGAYIRIKEIMGKDVDELKDSIFETAGERLKHEIASLKIMVGVEIEASLMKIYQDFKENLNAVWIRKIGPHVKEVLESEKKALKDLLEDISSQDEKEEREGWDEIPETVEDPPAKRLKTDDSEEDKGSGTVEKSRGAEPVSEEKEGGRGFPETIEDPPAKKLKTDDSEEVTRTEEDSKEGNPVSEEMEDGNVIPETVEGSQAKKQKGGYMMYAKKFSDRETITAMRLLVKAAESVGLIHSGPYRGTCFRVGRQCIMAACHVLTGAFGWLDGEHSTDINYERDANQRLREGDVFVTFSKPGDENLSQIRFEIKTLKYVNMKLDVIVAELVGNLSDIKAFSMFKDINREDLLFHLVGHDGGITEQFRDPSCKALTTGDVEEIIRQVSEVEKEPGTLQKYCELNNCPERLYFHSSFREGASGSPGLIVVGGSVKVCLMYLSGTAPDPNIPNYRKEWCIEWGVRMKAIMEEMKKQNDSLCKEIFEDYFLTDRIWYL